MNSAAKYGAGMAFIAFALVTLNWFIETSIAAGTIVYALLTLVSATVGIGLLTLHHRAERNANRRANGVFGLRKIARG